MLDDSDSENDEFNDYEAPSHGNVTQEEATESLKRLAVGGLSDEEHHSEINKIHAVLVHMRKQNDELSTNSAKGRMKEGGASFNESLQSLQKQLDVALAQNSQLAASNTELEKSVMEHELDREKNEAIKQYHNSQFVELQASLEEMQRALNTALEDKQQLQMSNLNLENTVREQSTSFANSTWRSQAHSDRSDSDYQLVTLDRGSHLDLHR